MRLPPERLAGFYSGEAPDEQRRYLGEILRWPDEKLEAQHDFIQWLFPLPEPGVSPAAPLLDAATIREFRSRSELQSNLRLSFLRMLAFYGLEMRDGVVVQAANFRQRAANWLTAGNHNHLRITRILRSLRLLGLETEARGFFECLAAIFRTQPASHPISARSFEFWRSAAQDELPVPRARAED